MADSKLSAITPTDNPISDADAMYVVRDVATTPTSDRASVTLLRDYAVQGAGKRHAKNEFGAAFDSSDDDTAAINAAAVAAAAVGGTGCVYCPDQTSRISGPIRLPSGVVLEGEGDRSTIKALDDFSVGDDPWWGTPLIMNARADEVGIGDAKDYGIGVRRLILDGNRGNNSATTEKQHGLLYMAAERCWADRLQLINMKGDGVSISAYHGTMVGDDEDLYLARLPEEIDLTRITALDVTRQGIAVIEGRGVRAIGGLVGRTDRGGLCCEVDNEFSILEDVLFQNFRLFDTNLEDDDGAAAAFVSGGALQAVMRRIRFDGITVTGQFWGRAFGFRSAHDIAFTNLAVDGADAALTGDGAGQNARGLEMFSGGHDSEDIRIAGFHFRNLPGIGMVCEGRGGQAWKVSDGVIRAGGNIGVFVNACDKAEFTSVLVREAATYGWYVIKTNGAQWSNGGADDCGSDGMRMDSDSPGNKRNVVRASFRNNAGWGIKEVSGNNDWNSFGPGAMDGNGSGTVDKTGSNSIISAGNV